MGDTSTSPTSTRWALPPRSGEVIETVEMHAGGQSLRIFRLDDPGLADCPTLLSKRRFIRDRFDDVRRRLVFEPRGHHDMYGAILVKPDDPDADIAVLFIHNEGYSTMCGHGVIALARFAVDYGLVKFPSIPETPVNIQCPCGLVKSFVEFDGRRTGKVRFFSVPAFVHSRDLSVDVPGFGRVTVDVSYGGGFYAFVPARDLGLDIRQSPVKALTAAAAAVTETLKKTLTIRHPEEEDLSFLYGTILTCGDDSWASDAAAAVNLTVYADQAVDRSPTGSGVTARLALQVARGQIEVGQRREFVASATGSSFVGMPVDKLDYHGHSAVIVAVEGRAFYSGTSRFTHEVDDPFKNGFQIR